MYGRQMQKADTVLRLSSQAPLTTQLYFKGDPLQKSDPLVRESLILGLKDNNGILEGKRNFKGRI